MEVVQGMLWSQKELDSFVLRRKTKKELLTDKLNERIVLGEEEEDKYAVPLKKSELMNYFFENNLESEVPMNRGVPQIVMTALAQYVHKNQRDLLLSDLVSMYRSIKNLDDEKDFIRKFRKANNISFFGNTSYTLMDFYIRDLEN